MGADYLEQDVIATRDGALVVLHDIILDNVSDVADVFPRRARDDGHYYCIDFDLDEIRTLRISERRNPDGKRKFPGRFSLNSGRFGIVTLEEEIRFIQGLNRSTGKNVGIYPEIKQPQWHRSQGIDITADILHMLERYGYRSSSDPVYLQCFDHEELARVRKEFGARIKVIQLMNSREDYPALEEIARYAQGIGVSIGMLCTGIDGDHQPILSSLPDEAREAGLAVHAYTFRADKLPDGIPDFASLLELFVSRLKVDGLFTDFPDLAVDWLKQAPDNAIPSSNAASQEM